MLFFSLSLSSRYSSLPSFKYMGSKRISKRQLLVLLFFLLSPSFWYLSLLLFNKRASRRSSKRGVLASLFFSLSSPSRYSSFLSFKKQQYVEYKGKRSIRLYVCLDDGLTSLLNHLYFPLLTKKTRHEKSIHSTKKVFVSIITTQFQKKTCDVAATTER